LATVVARAPSTARGRLIHPMGTHLNRACQLGLLAKDLAKVRCRQRGPQRDLALRQLVDRLGLMHGLPQKIGQLLSFSELDESDPAFTRLTENSPTLLAADACAEIEQQLERPIEDCFAWIDPTGISASIGQVHRAGLHDGREVAVKIQYPGLAEQTRCDLRALGWLTAPVGHLGRAYDLAAYRREIGEMLAAELDYPREAAQLRQFAEWTQTWPGLVLPEVVGEFSGPRLLTTTWLSGERLASARGWTLSERTEAAALILRFFLTSIFQWGCLHADPHPGNYRFRRGDGTVQMGVLDFGCVKQLHPAFVAGLRGLLAEAGQGTATPESVWQHFMGMGFNAALLAPLRANLWPVAQILYEPFLASAPYLVTGWNPGARIAALLGPQRMAFRLAGPPAMIYFLRTFQGVLHYLKAFAAPVNWHTTLAACGKQQARPKSKPSQDICFQSPTMQSDTLHIQVNEGGQSRVALTFGAGATDNLPDLVPLELRDKLRQRSIDLSAIAADARRRDYAPGELFALEDGGKTVRVWLA